MRKWKRVALAAALTATTATGLMAAGATANAKTASAEHRSQPVTASRGGSESAAVAPTSEGYKHSSGTSSTSTTVTTLPAT